MSIITSLRNLRKIGQPKDIQGFKVLPETGKPIKENVLHGTTQDVDFSTLSPAKAEDVSQGGVFFTDRPGTALEFTGSVEDIGQAVITPREGARTVLASVNFKKPLVLDADSRHVPNAIRDIKSYAKRKGYDGVVVKNAATKFNVGTEYITFSTDTIQEFDFKNMKKVVFDE